MSASDLDEEHPERKWASPTEASAAIQKTIAWANANLDPETWWKCYPALATLAAALPPITDSERA